MRRALISGVCVVLALGACGGGSVAPRDGAPSDAATGAAGQGAGGAGGVGTAGGGGSATDGGSIGPDAPKDMAQESAPLSDGGAETSDGAPPAGNVCATAIDVTPAGAAKRTTTGATANGRNNASLSLANSAPACRINLATDVNPLVGNDVAYSVVVPPHKRLLATVTPELDWQPALWLAGACAAPEGTCLALSAARTPGAVQSVVWTNAGPAPKTVFLMVDSAGSSGAFSLETSFVDPDLVPANDACAGAVPLTFPMGFTMVQGTTESATDDEHPASSSLPLACRDVMDSWVGSDVVYSAVVPAGMRLEALASALYFVQKRQLWNVALWVSESCTGGAATCLNAQDDDDSSNVQVVTWTNRSAIDKPVFIHVDSRDPSGGSFLMSASVGRNDTVPEDACPGVPRDPNVSWVGTTKMLANDDSFGPSIVSAACRTAVKAAWLGRDAVSSFVVPPGKTFSATVNSTTSAINNWLLLLSTACGSTLETGAACLAAGPSVSWKNEEAAARTVYLFVDTASGIKPTDNYQVTPSLK